MPDEQAISSFQTISEAVTAIAAGRMVVVVDDEYRENEGDLVMAAQFTTPDDVNFMATHGRGLVCAPLTAERAAALALTPMTTDSTARLGTRYTISVDALSGTTTGISTFDRAATIQALANQSTLPSELARPGHIFPLQAAVGGVLERPGHTEAAVDLCRIAGLQPVGVICEILAEDGQMARLPKLLQFAKLHNLPIITIKSLIAYRQQTEMLISKRADVRFPTINGEFRLHLYSSKVDQKDHLALVKGDLSGKSSVLMRIHSSCLTGDVFGSCRCDCGAQLEAAMHQIEEAGEGVVIYLMQEGRGIGLANKILAYGLQDGGRDTVEANTDLGFSADLRDYGIAAQILKQLGVVSVRIMTNNPSKVQSLIDNGMAVEERIPLEVPLNRHNVRYMQVKQEKLGHLLNLKNV